MCVHALWLALALHFRFHTCIFTCFNCTHLLDCIFDQGTFHFLLHVKLHPPLLCLLFTVSIFSTVITSSTSHLTLATSTLSPFYTLQLLHLTAQAVALQLQTCSQFSLCLCLCLCARSFNIYLIYCTFTFAISLSSWPLVSSRNPCRALPLSGDIGRSPSTRFQYNPLTHMFKFCVESK